MLARTSRPFAVGNPMLPSRLLNHSPCPSESALEEYARRRLREEFTSAVEEHLLVCERCRARLSTIEDYVRAMRTALRLSSPGVVFWQLHSTADGPVEIWVERIDDGRFLSGREGLFLSGGSEFTSQKAAIADAEQSFRVLFPEHCCGDGCLI